jgi:FAD-linked sulfhydryl oxidase
MAAYYPDEPTKTDQRRARQFFNSLAWMYPCTHCAHHLRAEMELSEDEDQSSKRSNDDFVGPVCTESRTALSKWVCRAHNSVNRVLGKPAFPCDIQSLDTRWRTGRAECWMEDVDVADTLGQG